ncbi:hypothetical protein EDD36DRAFT_199812 [Exophiala viscosa]|uniref:Zn(2)-C6 fungal-type domain-containing protein n=1 Tax=Exophiala viscosa TaxID=2486360 RepID=A0AAN6IDX4_9EURO|nr:hypothetical protein EDD36DRAFT_199812 [Exophiala viscosa]
MEKFHDLIRNQALLSAACVKQSSSPPLPSVTSEKRHRCPTCGQGFHRAEHLKRHQTRHTGAKPFSCTFCGRDFSRKDRLQTHYNSCQWRGDREAPSSVPKGRRPHACATCVSSKIRCDGGNPCTQCTKKNVECQQKLATKEDTPAVEKLGPTDDRVSIKALLNGGTDTFTETFNLPPSDLRVKSLQFHQKQKEAEETRPTTPAVADVSPQSIDYTGMFESFIDMNEQYLDFWNGPFGLIPSPNYSDMQLDLYNPSTNLSGEMRHGSIASESTPLQPSEQAQYVSSVNMAIYNKLWCLALDEKTRQELTSCLNFLLTPEKIPRFISMYFRNWHLNCPMLHKLSFDPSKVPTTLVISIVFVGAMYSKDQTERLAAKRLVDIAELVIFDSEIFSFDTEIIRSLQDNSVQQPAGPATDPSQDADWQTFQELQAGFLMVIAQYWAGPRIPKRRALESRLGEVIKIVRKYKYHHARHQRSDRISETLWLQKESRIRTIASIALLDCAGRIYSNFPCRMTLAEYDTDLPCKEAIFSSRHPFMQDDSIFAPRITISQAFAQLFQGKPKPLLSSSMALVRSNSVASETVPSMDASGDFTPFDLFILIHFLYTYIHSCIMTLSHNLPATSLGEKIDGHNSNPIFQDLKGALERWRQLWQALRNKETDESMKTAGMYRNSFHFWLVCQLIVSKEEAVDVITGMEVNCEDALTKLKVLFHNDNEHD